MVDLRHIQKKWVERWQKEHVFEADAKPGTPKFFATFPYPYMNGYLHLGHFYTLMRVEALARFKRHMGYNVLFPQGWHCTGSPIENAAQRIREKEEKQWAVMQSMGFSDKEIEKFGDPKYWTEYFPKEAKKDFLEIGFGADLRRSFITTDLNPHYDKFIRWQFNKLKEKGYVGIGKHPVVWDPKNNCPVGDHDRLEGEGETPQEFTLLKFQFEKEGRFVVVATLRPETIFGQTNVWAGPEIQYVLAKVNDEEWIISKPAAQKLQQQDKEVTVIKEISGKELLGKKVLSLAIGKELPILPSMFCNENKGTGLVTSVPSDAPDDWMGLFDLQKNDKLVQQYHLDYEMIKAITPIAIIETEELGDMPAVKVCTEMKIASQNDRQKLDQAKKIVYKKGFYEGVMNKNCGKYASLPVIEAKDAIKKELLENHHADTMYELTGRVVSRSLAECIVKIVSNQWFMKYSDSEWKKQTHEALSHLKLYPDATRKQFSYVIDWLNDWACAREAGLGTKLPWDEHWVIESLSDSTIYMAYYTIAHLLQEVPINQIDDRVFDYIFLNKGAKPQIAHIEEMKKEFEYWYPLDFRNSGKDLIQNHLAFFLFNHVAIFEKKYWPQGIGANGWITVNAEKMSKSKGNFILLRELPEKYGVDASRFTVLNGGEGLDDPNWDSSTAESMRQKLEQLYEFTLQYYGKATRMETSPVDEWLESNLHEILRDTKKFMEETMFRSAIQRGYFDLQKTLKWYVRRCNGNTNRKIMDFALELQVLLLSPFCPCITEELWENMGKKGFASTALWPEADEKKINKESETKEEIIETILDDVRAVKKVANLEKPKSITLYTTQEWKVSLYRKAKEAMGKTRDFKQILQMLTESDLKVHASEITKLLPKFLKVGTLPDVLNADVEYAFLEKEKSFLEAELGSQVLIVKGDSTTDSQAQKALPGKPSILLTK